MGWYGSQGCVEGKFANRYPHSLKKGRQCVRGLPIKLYLWQCLVGRYGGQGRVQDKFAHSLKKGGTVCKRVTRKIIVMARSGWGVMAARAVLRAS